MKTAFLFLLSLPCFAQQQVALQSITGTPPNVSYSFGGSQSQLGSSTVLYYAVIANFVGGSVQSNIVMVRNGPIVLSANNYVALGWLPVSGATTYDVLKLTGPSIPSGASSIALHTGLTVTSSTDMGTATSTYTLAAPPPTPVPYISYNSQDYTPPVLYVTGIGPIGAGGAGTVTSFSAGNLSPLFTTSVANPTTTPALSFTLDNFLADSIFGNFTGSSAAPSTQAIPACANDGAHALVYPSHTLTCESISSGGTPGGTNGQIQYNNSGAFGGFTASGDATVTTSTGAVSVNNLSHVTNGSLANSGLANSATTPNGQTCTLGSTCNVNSGAAAHSVSINEGSGAAIAGAAIGTGGRVLIDQGASADPAFEAVSQDVALTSAGAATVKGINAVPLCTGFTPANGQNLQYITGSSPNPCYTAAAGSSSGLIQLAQVTMTSSTACTSSGTIVVPTCTSGVVTFPSIPATYQGLKLVANAESSYAGFDNLKMIINADTGSHYLACSTPSTTCSSPSTSTSVLYLMSSNSPFVTSYSIYFPSYANASFYKNFYANANGWNGQSSSNQFQVVVQGGTWESASAITSLAVSSSQGDLVATSQFTLYAEQ
jgi:hypothetical protein